MIEGVNECQSLVEELLREHGIGFRRDRMMQIAEAVENRLVRRIDRRLQIAGVGAAGMESARPSSIVAAERMRRFIGASIL